MSKSLSMGMIYTHTYYINNRIDSAVKHIDNETNDIKRILSNPIR